MSTFSFSCELRSKRTCRYWNCLEGRLTMSSFRVVIPKYTRDWNEGLISETASAEAAQTKAALRCNTRGAILLISRKTSDLCPEWLFMTWVWSLIILLTSSSQYRRITSRADSVITGASKTSFVKSLEETRTGHQMLLSFHRKQKKCCSVSVTRLWKRACK